MNKPLIYAVDFDGTLCKYAWPGIGSPNLKLIQFLKDRQQNGVKLILWTCRVGDKLNEAVEWCNKYGLNFDAVNENLPEIVKEFGCDSRKIFANQYYDDRAVEVTSIRFQL